MNKQILKMNETEIEYANKARNKQKSLQTRVGVSPPSLIVKV